MHSECEERIVNQNRSRLISLLETVCVLSESARIRRPWLPACVEADPAAVGWRAPARLPVLLSGASEMAWGGKVSRMSEKVRRHFLRHTHRRLPPKENPHGVPSTVMKTLQTEGLSSDPVLFNKRLQELLNAYQANTKG
jgi:hypothetical protein